MRNADITNEANAEIAKLKLLATELMNDFHVIVKVAPLVQKKRRGFLAVNEESPASLKERRLAETNRLLEKGKFDNWIDFFIYTEIESWIVEKVKDSLPITYRVMLKHLGAITSSSFIVFSTSKLVWNKSNVCLASCDYERITLLRHNRDYMKQLVNNLKHFGASMSTVGDCDA